MQLPSFFKLKRRFSPKLLLSVAIAISLANGVSAQKVDKPRIDSLLNRLKFVKTDTDRCNTYSEISRVQGYLDPVASYQYANKLMVLAKKINWKKGMEQAYFRLGYIYQTQPDRALELENYNKALQLAIATKHKDWMAYSNLLVGEYYYSGPKKDLSLEYYKKTVAELITTSKPTPVVVTDLTLALKRIMWVYTLSKRFKEAHDYLNGLLTSTTAPYALVSIYSALGYADEIEKKI